MKMSTWFVIHIDRHLNVIHKPRRSCSAAHLSHRHSSYNELKTRVIIIFLVLENTFYLAQKSITSFIFMYIMQNRPL